MEKCLAREEDVGGEEKRKDFSADGRKESWELKTLVEDIHTKVAFIRFCTMNIHIWGGPLVAFQDLLLKSCV